MTATTTVAPLRSTRPARKALALAAALVAGNLIASVLLFVGADALGSDALATASTGALLAQLVLLGIWLALGDGRWYVRLLVAVPLDFVSSAGVALAQYLAGQLSKPEDEWAMIGFMFLLIVLASCDAVLPLRRLRDWRFTGEPVVDESAPPRLGQVNIADYLLWMIPFGGLMAVIRFILSVQDNFASQLSQIFFYVAALLATVVAAMLTVFSSRLRGWRKWLLLAALVVLVGLALAAPEIYGNLRQRNAFAGGPAALLVILTVASRVGSRGLCLIAGAAAGATLNSLLLRRLGFRLTWQ
jgi:hypothetical protein